MTNPYGGIFAANITVQHQVWNQTGTKDNHGNYPTNSFDDPVERPVIAIYPLHRLPHHDVVDSEYVGRVMIDFIMEVPDSSVYHKNDRVIYQDLNFRVQGFPFNWGGSDPFGFDPTLFGGSVHIERVT